MITLQDLATQALSSLTVSLLPVIPLGGGPGWHVGRFAVADIQITNTTPYPLHNIALEAYIFGAEAQFQSCYSWDGHSGFIPDLEPGAMHQDHIALMKALIPGGFALVVTVGAEVVPVGTGPNGISAYTVVP